MPEHVTEYRAAPVEFRESEGTPGIASGIVIRYGDEATFPWGKERFEPGAFGDIRNLDLIANRMHRRDQPLGRTHSGNKERGGMLIFDNDDRRLASELLMPDTQLGHDTCTELRLGLLRGQSLEFRATKEDYVDGTRVIKTARLGGYGIVDRPAYPGSHAEMRSWEEYLWAAEYRGEYTGAGLYVPPGQERRKPEDAPPDPEMRFAAFDCEIEAISGGVRGRVVYDAGGVEMRRAPSAELTGRLPYGVDGVVSMQRGELVRFLPGCFARSLDGEIYLLAGTDYGEPLASTIEGSLVLRDTEDALEFEAKNLPDTTYAHNFLGKLSRGLIRGLTAGWANAGSRTDTEDLPDGGKRIVVREATLCEFYPRSRSVAPGGGVQRKSNRSQAPEPMEKRERVRFSNGR